MSRRRAEIVRGRLERLVAERGFVSPAFVTPEEILDALSWALDALDAVPAAPASSVDAVPAAPASSVDALDALDAVPAAPAPSVGADAERLLWPRGRQLGPWERLDDGVGPLGWRRRTPDGEVVAAVCGPWWRIWHAGDETSGRSLGDESAKAVVDVELRAAGYRD